MTPLAFANKIRSYTKQNITSLSDSEILLLANPIKDSIAELIATRDIKGNYFILPSITDLIAGQREYALPPEVLDHIFSFEVAFSQDTPIPYVLGFPDDFRRLGLARTEANITANYTNGGGVLWTDAFGPKYGQVVGPRYEIQRRAIYLLSGDTSSVTIGGGSVVGGIRLRSRIFPADLTDLTDNTIDMSIDPDQDSFGMPRQFHELWARACSLEWKAAHPGAVPISALESKYEKDLEDKLSGIEQNDLSDEIIGRIPHSTGYDL